MIENRKYTEPFSKQEDGVNDRNFLSKIGTDDTAERILIKSIIKRERADLIGGLHADCFKRRY